MSEIFISYRRADSQAISDRLHEYLARAFGERNVFKDVDDIPIGADFRKVLHERVTACDVLLVVIGREWANVAYDDGTPRLDDPNDFVRIEVESGLSRDDLLVLPVLVNGARMPNPDRLPDGLREVCYRNAVEVRNDPDFRNDMQRLINQLSAIMRPTRKRRAPSVSLPRPRSSGWLIGAGGMLLAVFIFLLVYGIWLNGNNPGDDNPNTDGNTDLLELDPGDVGGDLFVKTDAFSDGFVQSISSDFESAGFGGSLGLTAFPDSYEALDAFCNGSSDVVITMVWLDAENCAAAGDSQLIEMWVAYSALAIVVHPDNDWVDSLSMDDLDELFGYAENWSDLDSDWPESTVWRYFPSRDTSEFQAFVNTVLSGDADLLLNLDHIVEGGDMLDQDALLDELYGIGFMSYQVYVDGDQALELAPIDDVIPDIDTVSNIDYPLAQPMILYTTSAALNDRPQVAAYVSYLLDVANEYAAGYGFTPMTEREYDHNLTLLQEAMGFE